MIFYSNDIDYEVESASKSRISSSRQRKLSSSDSDDDNEPKSKRGRHLIPFSEAAQITKWKKSNKAVEFLEKECIDLQVSYEAFLLFLLKRHAATNGDNEATNYFRSLLKDGIPKESNVVDPEKAFYIK